MPARGLFITFEGGDGAGKTTQISLLANSLRAAGRQVVCTREPGGSAAAEAIRELMVRGEIDAWSPLSEALMMFAGRSEHLRSLINPARSSGAVVLCDRFTDSTMAYQGIAGGVGKDVISALDSLVVGSDGPDTTFILDIDPVEGLRRASARDGSETRFERKGMGFHADVRRAFLSIARENQPRCFLIDAAQSPEIIHQAIAEVVFARLAEADRRGS